MFTEIYSSDCCYLCPSYYIIIFLHIESDAFANKNNMNRIEVYYNKCDNQLQSSGTIDSLMGFYKEMHPITLPGDILF